MISFSTLIGALLSLACGAWLAHVVWTLPRKQHDPIEDFARGCWENRRVPLSKRHWYRDGSYADEGQQDVCHCSEDMCHHEDR